jgi:hypothetical protein
MTSKANHKHNLENLPKENPFGIPEGYFQGFSDRLKAKIDAGNDRNKKTIPLFRSYKTYLSLAAGLMLFAAISYTMLHLVLNQHSPVINSTEQYAAYIENDIESYDAAMLIQAYSSMTENNYTEEQDLTTEKMIQFLIDENIELDLIINEL